MLQISNILKRDMTFKYMKSLKKEQIIIPVFLSLLSFAFFSAPLTFAAPPDGLGPAADSVVSSSQGLMKNGSPVPVLRSDPTSALGVPENNTIEGNFFSLGFGGNLVLGLDNGIINGAIIIESTELFYPGEKADIEMSDDGVTWVMAGTVTQDGTVNKPDGLVCARFIRITDVSDPAIFSDATADGYDVDGVQSTGDPCTITPTPTEAPTPTPTPTSQPSSNSSNDSGSNSNSSSNSNQSSGSSSNNSTAPAPTATPAPVIARQGTNPCIPSGNPLVPCFPDTGNLAPLLPNTGNGPDNKNIAWIIGTGLLLSVIIFSIAKRRYKLFSK